VRLLLHKGEWGGGRGRGGAFVHPCCCLSSPISFFASSLVRQTSLWSSVVTATSCHCHLPVSIIVMLLLSGVVINAKGGRGWGVTWQWVLWWLLGVVAVRQEKEVGRAYNILTCPMHCIIAIWMMWHIPRGSLRCHIIFSMCHQLSRHLLLPLWLVCVHVPRWVWVVDDELLTLQRVRWRSMCVV